MEELTVRRFDWFFDSYIGLGIRWDNYWYPLHLSLVFPFITITIGIGKKANYYNDNLPSITDQSCQCSKCGWIGTVWDCEGDIDGDGSLGCPECLEIIEVIA